LDGFDSLVYGWAGQADVSGPRTERARLAQYARMRFYDATAVKEDYLEFVKSWLLERSKARDDFDGVFLKEIEANLDQLTVSDLARELGLDLLAGDGYNAYQILARMALPIYITTGYHTFLEQALLEEGKKPHSLSCRWRDDLPDDFSATTGSTADYEPAEPLVFHLFGLDSAPESLVFTEEDHLRFLTRLALDPDIVPPVVRQAMTLSSLLLLGYQMWEWEFRAVFRGLILGQARRGRRMGVATQLVPESIEPSRPEQVREFIERYLDSGSFSVYSGPDQSFLHDLWERQAR